MSDNIYDSMNVSKDVSVWEMIQYKNKSETLG